jgi:class 3 adenylate cyclase
MDGIVAARELRLASPPAALWPLLSNTNRMNRASGLPSSEVARVDGSTDRRVSARLGPLRVSWRERPFDYVAERGYRTVREFENGPLARFEATMTLSPDGSGSRVVLRNTFTPRSPLMRVPLRIFAEKATSDLADLVKRVDASLARAGELPALPRTATPGDEALLSARARALESSGADKAAAARLVEHLRSAPDDEVVGFRPFELADRWGVPRLDALSASLHAVKAGLLEMRWEVLCPNCSIAPESRAKLSELSSRSACPGCGIDYSIGFDEHVELRFSVHPAVRAATKGVFCAGSPAHSPQAVAQQNLAAGEAREIELELGARSYRVLGLAGRGWVRLRPRADGPAALDVDLGRMEGIRELAFRPGPVRLRLSAPAAELVRVEAESWREAGATAALVTSLQEFRSLFSSEVLAPGLEIGVKRLALLFTDLKSSTALYERVGDATAYGVVRDHFDYLTAIVAERRGAVVKTIGDAVMAVFTSPADALEAALDMQERIAELDARLKPRDPVILKVGVHEGAAIAINASGILDYFGTTANVAARVQNESEGGDVVITDVLRQDPSAAAVLARREPAQEPFDTELKGLTGARRLWRLRPRAKK